MQETMKLKNNENDKHDENAEHMIMQKYDNNDNYKRN